METGDPRLDQVLSLSPFEDDHARLNRMFQDAGWPRCRHSASTLEQAMALLHKQAVSVAICERDLPPATWRDVLRYLVLLPRPPLLIVTSRLADEELWAEALDLGAFDVLAKPFQAAEVLRIVGLARLCWASQRGARAQLRARAASAPA